MKKKEFICGVASLSASMLIIQSASMGFSVFVSSRFGSTQMGLLHLVMSVYSFALTVAISGMPLAVTRLVSESASHNAIGKCLALSLCFGLFAFGCMFAFADKIAVHLIKEPLCAVPVKILSAAMPFISVSGIMRGYFTGLQKVGYITVSHMAEEFSYMAVTVALMKAMGTEHTGVIICTTAMCAAAALTCICDCAMFLHFKKNRYAHIQNIGFKNILSISMPVAAGSYLRSGLVAVENLIIPSALLKSGMVNPLAGYGAVKAMAMPVITFPYVFLQSLTSLLVPEISRRRIQNKKSVMRAAKASLAYTFAFALAIAVFLLMFGEKLGAKLYGDSNVGKYITALALLAVPMYIDTVTDSLLKGLNQQVYSLKINIADSLLRVPAMYFILPHSGVYGYIAVLYISELLNLALSFKQLKKVAAFDI